MDDSIDDLLDLQDEIMEENFEEDDFHQAYEDEFAALNEQVSDDLDPPLSKVAKVTSRDVDMIGFQATREMDTNTKVLSNNSSSVAPLKKKTPQEFAKYMQEVRMASIGESDLVDRSSTSLFTLANKYMYELPPVKKLSLREVAGCTSVVPPATAGASEYLPIILSNGRRLYLSNRMISLCGNESIQNYIFDPFKKNLLSVSYDDLSRQAEEIETQASLMKRRLIEQELARDQTKHRNVKQLNGEDNKELWVDKYAPLNFTQLLSAEKTNRDVLKALKRWDRFVFKNSPTGTSSSSKLSADATKDDEGRFFADDGRPKNKIILLCGPPGTGKTTLAHVAAMHCGYRPIEVNASDDRSPEALKEMLARATQNATLDVEKKPNCIIFDEIDGMDGNKKALEILLDVIKAPLSTSKSQSGKKSGKKSGNKAASGVFALTRPLICICNDQYAPVLRDLRRLSDIFVFTLPSESRLSQRLKHICTLEHIEVSRPAVLSELISITGHDIRSTINNLQFAAMKAKDRLFTGSETVTSSSSASQKRMDLAQVIAAMMQTGLKDDQLDSYQVWQRIFASRPVQSKGNASTKNASADDSQMMLAVNAMQDHGEFDHLIDGIHENIIPRPPPPSKFSQQIGLPPPPAIMNTSSVGNVISRFAVSFDWLSHVDTMIQSMRVLSDGFQLLPHIAVAGGAVHFCHAVTNPSSSASASTSTMRFEWPRKEREVFYARQQRLNILEMFQQQCLQRAHSTVISKQAVSVDGVSALLDIFTPRVRPLPMLSLSATEKATLSRVVEAMDSCGVSYTPLAVADEREAAEMLGTSSSNKFGGMKNRFTKATSQSAGSNNSSIFLQDNIVMVLEPNLSLLVRYQQAAGAEELRGRHHPVSSDLRSIVYTEQRKYAISQWEARVTAARASSSSSTAAAFGGDEKDSVMDVDQDQEEHANTSSKQADQKTSNTHDTSTATVNPWERPGHEAEEEAKRSRGSMSTFLVKRPLPETSSFASTTTKKAKVNTTTQSISVPASLAPSAIGVAAATPSTVNSSITPSIPKKPLIVFKFNQGYSNAVRRPVYLRDFIPNTAIHPTQKST